MKNKQNYILGIVSGLAVAGLLYYFIPFEKSSAPSQPITPSVESDQLHDMLKNNARPMTMQEKWQDGFLTPEEAFTDLAADFVHRDKNGDGAIDREEFLYPLFNRPREDGTIVQVNPTRTQMLGFQESFARMDKNGDGKIISTEFMARALHNFDARDFNKDGKISKSEFTFKALTEKQ